LIRPVRPGARPFAVVASAALLLAACAPAPPLDLPPRRLGSGPLLSAASPEVEAWESARRAAYRPRRFKALFRGEASQKVGLILRGYVAVYWDGEVLFFKTSAPLAGEGRSGALRLHGQDGDPTLLPGAATASDVIGVLLGVLDLPAVDGGGGQVRLAQGRAATVDGGGRVVAMTFPGDLRVKLEPGEGVPRKILGVGPEGRVALALESFGPWPEGETIP
jgi:hypothetical protein